MISRGARKLLVVTLFVGGVAGMALVARGSLQANADSALLATGRQILNMAPPDQAPDAHTLLINGRTMAFSTETTSQSANEALDAFAATCESGNAAAKDKRLPPTSRSRAWRGGDEKHGFVACGLAGGTLSDPASLLAAARDYVSTKRVSTEVPLRFLYAETRAGRTQLAHFNATLDIEKMFPDEENAPVDPSAALPVPPPPHARRMLSVAEQGRAYEVSMHDNAGQTPSETAGLHRMVLQSAGMVVFQPNRENASLPNARTSFFVQGPDLFALVVFEPNGRGGTTTAIAASRADGVDALTKLLGAEQ